MILDAKAEQFIANCWTIIRAKGVEDEKVAKRAQMAWGLKPTGATCYQDKVIEIVAEAEPSKVILVTKLDTKNPLLCTDKEGKPFRWHGEFHRIAGHVRLLVVGILQKQEDDDASV